MAALSSLSTKDGQPHQRALSEAAIWYTRLCSGTATAADRQAWNEWHAAQEAHRQAWSRIEAMQHRLHAVPAELAAPVLQASVRSELDTRRHLLRSIMVLAGVGAVGWLGWQQPMRQQWMADLRTGTGERHDVTLPDGSQLALNTRTAVDVAYDNQRRLLLLRSGEILIETAHDAATRDAARPFFVDTPHGRVQALGTRFLVRSEAEHTRVTVLDKAVEVLPAGGVQEAIRLQAGTGIEFDRDGFVGSVSPVAAGADAWQQGSLIADNMPLAGLLEELGRYRSGIIACDPAIADLKISGAFPVADTDRALQVLINGFPLRVEFRTRYWVRVLPA